MAVSANKGKVSSVDNAISQIHRQFGKGSIMRLAQKAILPNPASITYKPYHSQQAQSQKETFTLCLLAT